MKVSGSTIQQLEKDKTRSRCRKWRLWATTEQGRKSKRFTGTYTQAEAELKSFVAELEGAVPNAETFGAYAESWARWREASGGFDPGTIANDKRNVRALLRSPLAKMRMDSINAEDCRSALVWVRENPASGRDTLSGTTMNKVYGVLHMIMSQARREGRIAHDPTETVQPPKVDTAERKAMDPPELMAFLDRVDQLPLDGRSMALYMIAGCGLRRAEACALRDGDVAGGVCNVVHSVKERDGTTGDPKTFSGKRSIPMPARVAAKVDEWRAERAALGLADAPTLCCNTRGGLLRPQLLYRWWAGDSKHVGVRDSLGCAGLGLHELRHSNLSMMARHMTPFDLKSWAGWSSIAPARIYVHDSFDAMAAAVDGAWSCNEDASDAPKTHQNEKQARE
ncbi:MAG: tyrosine-type recombinase/integrase [Eggerthellaceae bacterium]|nr:tyrosine-type recombinase/integrase [Eggerthellaceae bacterium]